MKLSVPDTRWDVTYDSDVIDTLRESKQSSKELHENLRSTLTGVAENPLKGTPKTGELRGCRTTHVEHLVVVWEARSESGSPITSRAHIGEIEEVYIHGIGHHDEMTQLVGCDDPVEVERVWGVRFTDFDVMPEINDIHKITGVEIEDQDWSDNGVTIKGTADPDKLNTLTDTIENGKITIGGQLLN